MNSEVPPEPDPILMAHEMSIQHALVQYVLRHPDHFIPKFIQTCSWFVSTPTRICDILNPPGPAGWESLP